MSKVNGVGTLASAKRGISAPPTSPAAPAKNCRRSTNASSNEAGKEGMSAPDSANRAGTRQPNCRTAAASGSAESPDQRAEGESAGATSSARPIGRAMRRGEGGVGDEFRPAADADHRPFPAHQLVKRRGGARRQADAAVGGRSAEEIGLQRAVNRVLAMEEDRVRHRLVAVLPRIDHRIERVGAELAARRGATEAARGNRPFVAYAARRRRRASPARRDRRRRGPARRRARRPPKGRTQPPSRLSNPCSIPSRRASPPSRFGPDVRASARRVSWRFSRHRAIVILQVLGVAPLRQFSAVGEQRRNPACRRKSRRRR